MVSAGGNVSNPDDTGAKHGYMKITFNDPDKKPAMYSVYEESRALALTGVAVQEICMADGTLFGLAPNDIEMVRELPAPSVVTSNGRSLTSSLRPRI
jgi:hypothetical protein